MESNKALRIILVVAALIAGKLFSQYFITGVSYNTFKSSDGKYSITMPAARKSDVQSLEFGFGKVKIFIEEAADKNLGFRFGTSYSDYPKEVLAGNAVATMLENAADGQYEGLKGVKMLNRRKISLRNYPGIEIHFLIRGNAAIKIRSYLAGTRLYQMMAGAPEEDIDHANIRDFFDSFDIVD